MTEFKPGDRVRVEFEGVVESGPDEDGDYDIELATPAGPVDVVAAPDSLTLIPPVVCVGDVLTSDDPCPPKGTVLRERRGLIVEVGRDGIYAIQSVVRWDWKSLNGSYTVLYVPPQKEEQR
jgi:hypothetical protein